jgi:hypothetical protein
MIFMTHLPLDHHRIPLHSSKPHIHPDDFAPSGKSESFELLLASKFQMFRMHPDLSHPTYRHYSFHQNQSMKIHHLIPEVSMTLNQLSKVLIELHNESE